MRKPSTVNALAGFGHAAEQLVHEPADGRHVFAVEVVPEQLRQLVDRQAARHPESSAVLLLDRRLLDVVLVADLADDLLENVLDRDDAGGAAELVDDDGDVRAARLKVAELLVDASCSPG